MLNSRQRAQLRALANPLDTIVDIGKSGITDNIVTQVTDALTARELIKGRVLETSGIKAKEALTSLCETARAEPVQFIGNKFVIYKANHDIPKEKRIKLCK